MRERHEPRGGRGTTGFLLGVVAALLAANLVSSRALLPASFADDDDAKTEERSGADVGAAARHAGDDGLWAVTGLAPGGNHDVLWVVDSKTRRLAVYDIDGTGVPQVRGVRNIDFDLQLDDLGKQDPSVKDIAKIIHDAEKKREAEREKEREKEKEKEKRK